MPLWWVGNDYWRWDGIVMVLHQCECKEAGMPPWWVGNDYWRWDGIVMGRHGDRVAWGWEGRVMGRHGGGTAWFWDGMALGRHGSNVSIPLPCCCGLTMLTHVLLLCHVCVTFAPEHWFPAFSTLPPACFHGFARARCSLSTDLVLCSCVPAPYCLDPQLSMHHTTSLLGSPHFWLPPFWWLFHTSPLIDLDDFQIFCVHGFGFGHFV